MLALALGKDEVGDPPLPPDQEEDQLDASQEMTFLGPEATEILEASDRTNSSIWRTMYL